MDERHARRAKWPIRRTTLEQASAACVAAVTTPSERLAMMWDLAVESWTVAGREIPTFERGEMPTRLIRPGEE